MQIDHYRQPGSRLYFEYHCWEDSRSSDAQVWYRSHQQVTVIGHKKDCGHYFDMTFKERCESGHQIVYMIRFDDGFEYDVFEDELLDSPNEYQRPNPPL